MPEKIVKPDLLLMGIYLINGSVAIKGVIAFLIVYQKVEIKRTI